MEAVGDGAADRPLADLASSARGWHGAQLAVLAFIGLCGVLSRGDSTLPRWLQITAGVLAIAALTVACLAIFVVASVAWPFVSPDARRDVSPQDAARRLRLGIALTFVAVGLMALAASSRWWPETSAADGASAAIVRVTAQSGQTACGTIVAGPAATIRLATVNGTVELPATQLADIRPVTRC